MTSEEIILAGQIQAACRRPLEKVFLEAHREQDLDEFDLLAREVERVRPLGWRVAPTESLQLVLAAAADTVTDGDSRIAGTWGQMAHALIGTRDAERLGQYAPFLGAHREVREVRELPTAGYTQKLAAVRRGFIGHVSADEEEKLRKQELWPRMSRALLALPAQQTLPTPPTVGRLPGEIRRVAKFLELQRQLSGSARVVVLWGESGNGKTYLAHQIVRELYSGQRTIFIGTDDGSPSEFDRCILDFLIRRGVTEASSWDSLARERVFTGMVTDPECADLLIFDNVSLGRLAPILATSAVKVLVVSRTTMTFTGGELVWMPPYTDDEALAAASAAMPATEQKSLIDFCAEVGNRPLLIELAGKLVALADESLDDLQASLRLNASVALEGLFTRLGGEAFETPLGERVTRTTVEVYYGLLLHMQSRVGAMEVLDALLWMPRTVSLPHLEVLVADPAMGLDAGAVRAGIAALQTVAILAPGSEVSMNDLTRSILRALAASRADSTVRRFFERASIDQLDERLRSAIVGPGRGGTPSMRLAWETRDEKDLDLVWATHASVVFSFDALMQNIAPGRQVRFFQIAANEYIIVQGNVEVFSDVVGTQIGFVELGLVEPPVVTTRGTRAQLSRYRAHLVAQHALIANVATRVNGSYGATEHSGGSGIEFWRVPDDGLRHDLITVFPRDAAIAHAFRVWSRCGRWFTPTVWEEGLATSCPACLAAREPRPGWSNYESDIFALWFLRDPLRMDDWRLAAMIYSALMFASVERGEWPAEMPSQALQGPSDDAVATSELGAYSAWIHLFLARDLIEHEEGEDIRALAADHLALAHAYGRKLAGSDLIRVCSEIGIGLLTIGRRPGAIILLSEVRRVSAELEVVDWDAMRRLNSLSALLSAE